MAFLKMFLLLVLMPLIALADDPLTPLYDAICDKVNCGKGTCVGNITYPLGYHCECDAGWTRTVNDSVNLHVQFLPCVLPQCTLSYSSGCQVAPVLPEEKPIPSNISMFDPCYWSYCGGGTCTKNFTYNHLCTCNSGYSNLLDIPYFPCYSQCAIGSDCANLGIKVANSNGTTGNSDTGPANENLPGKFQWMVILLGALLMAVRN
ncbi:uncharacterized protein [Euphorbia lathyris]|uniref:uncharacterized protein n=1 Tax=Euphorbia lathyris TaxID=212925 RepID=UPI003314481B